MRGVIGFRMIGSDSCGIIGFNQNSSNMRDGIYHLSHTGNTRVLTKHFNVQNVLSEHFFLSGTSYICGVGLNK